MAAKKNLFTASWPRQLSFLYEAAFAVTTLTTAGDVGVYRLLGSRPNTYTFTKALAESLIASEKGDLPVTIVRPSIGEF